jgi:CheY-like chemotaxis protein
VSGKMKKKILIVDDEPGIVRLLSMRLKAKGYDIFEAYDGLECVQIAEKEVPDLILLDFKMPLMSGLVAFEKLIQLDITKNIPVVFMTAYPKLEVKNQVVFMGAKGFISKPFISKDLELIIEGIINDHDFDSDYKNKVDQTYIPLN